MNYKFEIVNIQAEVHKAIALDQTVTTYNIVRAILMLKQKLKGRKKNTKEEVKILWF